MDELVGREIPEAELEEMADRITRNLRGPGPDQSPRAYAREVAMEALVAFVLERGGKLVRVPREARG